MEENKSFKILFFITLFIWAVGMIYPINPDYDLWMRLISGNSFLSSGHVILKDIFSYSPTHIWLDHEWGTSIIFAFIFKLAQNLNVNPIYAFATLKSFLIFLIGLTAFLTVKIKNPKQSSPYQILYFVLSLFAVNMVYASTVRSHMFTFLFFAIWLLILELYRKKENKFLLFLLPFLMLFWGNIHGGCLSGIGILILYSIGEFLNKKSPVPYLISLFACLAMLFINPYGFDYVKFIFEAGTMNRGWISEWQSPFITPLFHIKFIAFFLFIVIISIIQGFSTKFDIKNCDKTKLLTIAVTAVLGVCFTKLTPFFAISAAVFMFDDIYSVLKKANILSPVINPYNKAVYGIILLLALGSINLLKGHSPINLKKYPYMPVQFMKDNKISGNLFTDMTYGSFCIYKLFPQNKIFMDGRYEEVYNPDLLLTMKDFMRQEGKNPNAVINDFPTDIVLLNLPFRNVVLPAEKSLKELKWKEIYADNFWKIYVKPDYPIKELKKSEFDTKNALKTLFDTELFYINM